MRFSRRSAAAGKTALAGLTGTPESIGRQEFLRLNELAASMKGG
jgi:hypothetical protein